MELRTVELESDQMISDGSWPALVYNPNAEDGLTMLEAPGAKTF